MFVFFFSSNVYFYYFLPFVGGPSGPCPLALRSVASCLLKSTHSENIFLSWQQKVWGFFALFFNLRNMNTLKTNKKKTP